MVSIKFHFRGSSKGENREGRVFIRLIYGRRAATVTTAYRLKKEEWDEEKHLPLLQANAPERKEYLQRVVYELLNEKERIMAIASELQQEDRLTVQTLSTVYRKGKVPGSLQILLQELSRDLLMVGRVRTSQAYRSAVKRLLLFTGKEDIELDKVDQKLIKLFEEHLLDERKSMNTISFYMRNLRAMLSKAVKKGMLTAPVENPFTGVFTGVQVTRKRAISKEELARLNNLFHDPVSHIGKKERDALGFFLFSFHARGMSFIDMAYLKKENIRENRISYIRRKTGKLMEVELNPEAKKILRYFREQTKETPFLLPLLKENSYKAYLSALRLQNKRLKNITLTVSSTLSTHIARHSWATIAKGENIPLRVISECLGHASEKTTLIYLASFERSVLDEANRKVVRALLKAV